MVPSEYVLYAGSEARWGDGVGFGLLLLLTVTSGSPRMEAIENGRGLDGSMMPSYQRTRQVNRLQGWCVALERHGLCVHGPRCPMVSQMRSKCVTGGSYNGGLKI